AHSLWPTLLMLDEPSLGLAPMLVKAIFETIEEINEGGVTIFLVEQNARAALRLADKGYVLETGRTILSGSAEEVTRDERRRIWGRSEREKMATGGQNEL
ncbi:MAG: hypothetical protein KAT75_09595, partial [Dehalococcoidia bacterium]|nr:hypothetical protein [Dehalococcoidia bacterium]